MSINDHDLDEAAYDRLLAEYAEREDMENRQEPTGEGLVQELLRRRRKTPDFIERNLDGMSLVFVYGTLKTGGRLSSYMKGATFLGEAQSAMSGWNMAVCESEFPIALRSQKSSAHLFGEVYIIDTKRLAMLDSIEDNGGMYIRQEFFFTLLDQTAPQGRGKPILKAQVYVGNPAFWDGDGLRFLPTNKGYADKSVLCFNQMQKSGQPYGELNDACPF